MSPNCSGICRSGPPGLKMRMREDGTLWPAAPALRSLSSPLDLLHRAIRADTPDQYQERGIEQVPAGLAATAKSLSGVTSRQVV